MTYFSSRRCEAEQLLTVVMLAAATMRMGRRRGLVRFSYGAPVWSVCMHKILDMNPKSDLHPVGQRHSMLGITENLKRTAFL